MNVEVSKDEFQLDIGKPVSSIPPAVLKRCFGKQKPVVPHAQRLLVAARKDAKAPASKGDGGKGKGKSKSKSKSGKGGAAPKAKAKVKAAKSKDDTDTKSAYAVAKANFMKALLLGVCFLFESFEYVVDMGIVMILCFCKSTPDKTCG